jgi:glutathione synthase/RimK-type ligase-like ATP-grasp enzyme
MILVCGSLADPVTELVCARLESCGYAYRFIELGRFPESYQLVCRWKGSGSEGWIAGPDWRLDLDEISGVYVRFLGPEDRPPLSGLDRFDAAALRHEGDLALIALIESLDCPVVNRMRGGASNNSKPYQALVISQTGLSVPPTLVTSDPLAARAFHARHREVIYKSASGVRSIVRRLGPDQLERLDMLCHGPAHLQAFVPGHNIRVHTIGEQIFATRIESDAVDYRYAHLDGATARLEPVTIRASVEAACLRLAEEFDLLFAGIDLKETPEGEFFCFEVNPCPGFLYYERHTGQPISTAVAELLRGSGARSVREAVAAMT